MGNMVVRSAESMIIVDTFHVVFLTQWQPWKIDDEHDDLPIAISTSLR